MPLYTRDSGADILTDSSLRIVRLSFNSGRLSGSLLCLYVSVRAGVVIVLIIDVRSLLDTDETDFFNYSLIVGMGEISDGLSLHRSNWLSFLISSI
jgi:hypothetical protein